MQFQLVQKNQYLWELAVSNVKPLYIKENMAKEKFIQKAIKHPGALRKSLHVKEGENIPKEKLKKAEQSKNPTLKKRAVLAETLSKLRKHK